MSDPQADVAELRQRFEAGEAEALLPELRQRFAATPAQPGLLELYRSCLEQLQRWPELVALLDTARTVHGLWPPVSDQVMGLALLRLGEPARGLEHLQRALEEDPDSGWVHYGLGQALLQLDRAEEALAALRRASSLLPGFPWARIEAARLLEDHFQQPLQALLEAEDAHRRAPDNRDVTQLVERLQEAVRWLSLDQALDAGHLAAAEALLADALLAAHPSDAGLNQRVRRTWDLLQERRARQRGSLWTMSDAPEIDLDGVLRELVASELLISDLERAMGLAPAPAPGGG
ncbi:tetratricopeptide repeat protein [Synechococcus sp. RSCCF101]|uniref:tetratricopeptide repeat protein n=1 Tax=Synechococcus sp. RSCCF101 TaxID=2511069 RepID=UPI001246F093|nr:tetratricopeptide repeat protein [Synechococcus sp. RSCCF101]QEY32404.1 tetratricopeptide repeat protein [Synechococcus sp. RSCCF101]